MRIDIRPASATQLSNLTATVNNVKTIDLSWKLPIDDPSYRAAQVWVNTINDVETATLVATVAGNTYSYTAPDTTTRYFWIRTVNEWNRTDGPFTGPASATPKLINTEDIGVFDLATAKIINKLSVSNITGLGALATISKVDAYSQVNNLGGLAFANAIYANEIGAGTLASGVIYAGKINADQVNAGTMTGHTIRTSASGARVVINESGDNSIRIYDYYGSLRAQFGAAGGGTVVANAGGSVPAIHATGGYSASAILASGNIVMTSGIASLYNTEPGSPNAYNLGSSWYPWANVYSATAVTVTSDARAKTDIADSDLGLAFIKKLRPVSYRLKVGINEVEDDDEAVGPFLPGQHPKKLKAIPGTRTHYGLLAQEVKEALGSKDAAMWILQDKNDPDSGQALRYEELIAPLIKAVQELSEVVTRQQAQIDALTAKPDQGSASAAL